MSTDATLAYVRGLMTKAGVAPRFYEQPPAHSSQEGRPTSARPRRNIPLRDAPGMPASPPAPASPPLQPPDPHVGPGAAARPSPRPSTAAPGNASSITPDIEIHVRRPLDRRSNKLVERLARIARDLFDDEP